MELAPARFLCVHALELGLKAALAARLEDVPRTHNIGGEFGKHFRSVVGVEVARRINKILGDYDGPRYPEWELPEQAAIGSDIEFVERLLTDTLPRLILEGSG